MILKNANIPGQDVRISDHGSVLHNARWRLPTVNRNGAAYIGFRVARRQKNYFIHRLVALMYVKNPEGKRYVRWKNGDTLDNRAGNLEWVGTLEGARGGRAVLTPANVANIKLQLARGGVSQAKLAGYYGVHPSLISHIKAGRRWGDI